MEKISVTVWNNGINLLPKYASDFASGLDLIANIPPDPTTGSTTINIEHGETKLIKTGLFVAIPVGYEIQVRPRRGLALKLGITVLNSPGTVDADYRGEIGVIIHNTHNTSFVVYNGDRIAQAILTPVYRIEWNEVKTFEELPSTIRGTGGFGSTGK